MVYVIPEELLNQFISIGPHALVKLWAEEFKLFNFSPNPIDKDKYPDNFMYSDAIAVSDYSDYIEAIEEIQAERRTSKQITQ